MKRFVAAFWAAAFLACLASAGAAAPGSSSDPLVTKSYAEGAFASSVSASGGKAIDAALKPVYSSAAAEAKTAYDSAAASAGTPDGFSATKGYAALDVPAGSLIGVAPGGSLVLAAGDASVTFDSGAVVDAAEGTETASGSALVFGHRYITAEDTTAAFSSSSGASVMVDGAYSAGDGVAPSLTRFVDVGAEDWYYGAVKYICGKGYFHDTDGPSFRAAENADRATLVYALWKAAGSPSAKAAAFTDLTEDWYAGAAAWAGAKGVVLGYGDGRFGPGDSVTREQTATIMYRYAAVRGEDVSGANDLSGYTDAGDISDWAAGGMKWANARGLITGTPELTLMPQGTATRSQMAAIVMRFDAK